MQREKAHYTVSSLALLMLRSRKQTESERQRSMVRIFINMLISMVKRRQLWNVLPLDPGAWFVLYREHTAGVQKAIASQLGNPIHEAVLSKSPWVRLLVSSAEAHHQTLASLHIKSVTMHCQTNLTLAVHYSSLGTSTGINGLECMLCDQPCLMPTWWRTVWHLHVEMGEDFLQGSPATPGQVDHCRCSHDIKHIDSAAGLLQKRHFCSPI